MEDVEQAVSKKTDKTRPSLERAGLELSEGEVVLVDGEIHPAIYWKAVVVCILGLILLIPVKNMGLFILLVSTIMFIKAYLMRQYLILIATNKRVLVRSGIVYVDMIQLRHSQVETVDLGITPIGQIFGYGSVNVTGTGQRSVMVPFIRNATGFRRKINEALLEKE